ncbi:MAG: hypothetical protein IJ692_04090 [Alloprevotella sp.]|nr:hypothetical protein [Alloprevotella sp.]MBR1652552.1 hypothetical protein [Alloprevotella sp.]
MRSNPNPIQNGALTPAQLQQLAAQCNRMPVQQLLTLIEGGRIRFPEDLTMLSPERKAYIEDVLSSRPNPQEQAEWSGVEALLSAPLAEMSDVSLAILVQKLSAYIAVWQPRMTPKNHIAEANAQMATAEAEVHRREAEKELREWNLVNKSDGRALLGYLDAHPTTVFKGEIDDFLWQTVDSPATRNKILAAQEYRNRFPQGKHVAEAISLVREYADWMRVKAERDIFSIRDFVSLHVGSRFYQEAQGLFLSLKEEEMAKMRMEPSGYSRDFLNSLRRAGVFTDQELIAAGVHSQQSLAILDHFDEVKDGLPDIQYEISRCRQECDMGRTDIFFWGIPATGKSCILMGLIGSNKMMVDLVSSGGPYAAALSQYLDAGCTIGQTPGEFVATIQGTITDDHDTPHRINLVEMAGETFAFKVANNPDGELSFADMGNGAATLLANNNRKMFFLIVDPTANVVAFNHFVDTEGGRKLVRSNVNQRITLQKMINLMERPENTEIMKKVDYLHVIMTKADELAEDREERNAKATELFMSQYRNLLDPVTNLCKRFNINQATDGVPMLYTFSLGDFYAGGVYQYNNYDADKLVDVMMQTEGVRNTTFGERLKNLFN